MMKLIETTPKHFIFEDYFQGIQVLIMKNKATGVIHINADSVAKVLGYADTQDMMSSDKVLDLCNEVKNETGIFPIETV